MDTLIQSFLKSSAELKQQLAQDESFVQGVKESAQALAETRDQDGTVYACGNGGSACDAMHLCEELVARFKRERKGIRAMHFIDGGTLTCWANDYDYASAFARQAETFCRKGDCLVAISTSGNSENVIRAVEAAKKNGAKVIGLTGKDGGKLAPLCDHSLMVPSQETERIQEVHITIIHTWCELLETELS